MWRQVTCLSHYSCLEQKTSYLYLILSLKRLNLEFATMTEWEFGVYNRFNYCLIISLLLSSIIRASLVAQRLKHLPAMRETQVRSGLGRSPGEGNGNPLQYSVEFHGQRSWLATVHRVAKSWTQLSSYHTHTHTIIPFLLSLLLTSFHLSGLLCGNVWCEESTKIHIIAVTGSFSKWISIAEG